MNSRRRICSSARTPGETIAVGAAWEQDHRVHRERCVVRSWPDADLAQRQLLRRLLGVKQTYMRASCVKRFFRDQHFFSSYFQEGLTRAQFCIDGTAGLLAWPR